MTYGSSDSLPGCPKVRIYAFAACRSASTPSEGLRPLGAVVDAEEVGAVVVALLEVEFHPQPVKSRTNNRTLQPGRSAPISFSALPTRLSR
jgi:hypothetical protein